MTRQDPDDLFDLDSDRPDLAGTVLVHALSGFVDAGGAVATARRHLLDALEHRTLARFDVDRLYDYRARRPPMRYERDHWAGYEAPALTLELVEGRDGVPFLLLVGPEPDVSWELFTAAVTSLVDRLGVRLVVGLEAFPMPVPHTRPPRVIVHGSRRDLFADHEPWLGVLAVPGSAGNLLEYRLGGSGHDALGLAVPVPHYVAQSEYPAAALALLRELAARAGVQVPLEALEAAAATTRSALDEQVAQSSEVADVVRALEQQHDEAVSGAHRSLLAGDAELPSADELGAELERFLADHTRGDGERGEG